jgi:methylenetetrahydrofolate dehydrogenase (NADP+)/methenyltetrahydrofolate cyclohydrolase
MPPLPAGVRQGEARPGWLARLLGLAPAGLTRQPGDIAIEVRRGDATVTVAHSRTRDLAAVTREADIVIAAIGRPHFLGADHIREGAVVIDVGINRIDDPSAPKGYRLVGDVDYDAVAEKCAAITPVPGGVGPMTIAMLMSNCVTAAERLAG